MNIQIEDIVNAIATSAKDTEYYYDTETGDMEMTIDGEILGNRDIDLSDDERYIKMPDRYELDETKIVTDFARHADDPVMRAKLLQIIAEDESLKSFRDAVQDLNISVHWDRFRTEVFRQAAIEWCEYNGIEYTEGDENEVVTGGIYQHFKGKKYKVLGVAKHSETLDELVIYQSLNDASDLWARPKKMFCSKVTVDGQEKNRFELVERP
ncbi:MAG: UPF0158 family protein [Eubacteriales bacterium]|nr:UPF0158 family protein [Eubacteriales bacterium]